MCLYWYLRLTYYINNLFIFGSDASLWFIGGTTKMLLHLKNTPYYSHCSFMQNQDWWSRLGFRKVFLINYEINRIKIIPKYWSSGRNWSPGLGPTRGHFSKTPFCNLIGRIAARDQNEWRKHKPQYRRRTWSWCSLRFSASLVLVR